MKRLLLALCLIALMPSVLPAQELSREERKKAIDYLEKTRADLLAATKGLSDAQWHFKPATNRWSVAEVTEHIAASEDFILNIVQEKVMKSPAPAAGTDT